jgi:hypothetical protein
MDLRYGQTKSNPHLDPEYAAKLDEAMKCASVNHASTGRMGIRARIEERAQRLRDEAFRLDHLARELPHLSPEAEDAFFQMIARGNF